MLFLGLLIARMFISVGETFCWRSSLPLHDRCHRAVRGMWCEAAVHPNTCTQRETYVYSTLTSPFSKSRTLPAENRCYCQHSLYVPLRRPQKNLFYTFRWLDGSWAQGHLEEKSFVSDIKPVSRLVCKEWLVIIVYNSCFSIFNLLICINIYMTCNVPTFICSF